MTHHRQILIFWTILLILQLYRFYQQDQELRFENPPSNSRSYDDDDITLLLESSNKRKRRKLWAHVRSSLWVNLVLQKKLLKDEGQYEKTFRMTRHSFEQLHSFLGT